MDRGLRLVTSRPLADSLPPRLLALPATVRAVTLTPGHRPRPRRT
jgi:hypothetical protein